MCNYNGYLNYSLPKKWCAEEDIDNLLLYNPKGNGAITISFFSILDTEEPLNMQISVMAKRFIDLGFYISLAGPVTFKNARVPKDVAEKIGLEHLLIETDCPYLTPHPYRGSLNEPANVVYIAQEIAKLKNMEIESVASQTTFNAKKVFGIK